MPNYPTEKLFKDISKDYGAPIKVTFSNADIMAKSYKYISFADFILIGPTYLEFTKSAYNKVDKYNDIGIELYRISGAYVPNVGAIETAIGSFYTSDIYYYGSNPDYGGYSVDKMRPYNLLPFYYSTIIQNALLTRKPLIVTKQLKIECFRNGNAVYDGDINIYIHQFVNDITSIVPF